MILVWFGLIKSPRTQRYNIFMAGYEIFDDTIKILKLKDMPNISKIQKNHRKTDLHSSELEYPRLIWLYFLSTHSSLFIFAFIRITVRIS